MIERQGTMMVTRSNTETKGHKKAQKSLEKARAKSHQSRSTLPSVNLLSPAAFERLTTRRLRLRFVAGGVALIMLIAAAWATQNLRVGEAQQLLAVERAETARLTAETQTLIPVRAFVTGVDEQMTTVSETMAREMYFSTVLEGMQDAAPSGVRLDSVGVTLAEAPVDAPPADAAASEGTEGPEGTPETEAPPASTSVPSTVSPCPGPDPFNTRTVVGCITVSGTATSRGEVGDLVIALGADELFVEPFISTTTTADASRVSFSGSVGLSPKVFSKRYEKLEQLLVRGGAR